ncbi:MAG: hypothetical protein Q4C87_06015 [Actinomycetaceae bacterium]|nr:hypothetical protein [Actinomycetaceae bacterium]
MRSFVTYVGGAVGLIFLLAACAAPSGAQSSEHQSGNVQAMSGAIQGRSGQSAAQQVGNRSPLLTVENSNWGEVSNAEDYLSREVAIVYGDGSVEFYREYNLRGKVDQQQRTLSEAEFADLRRLLASFDGDLSRKAGVDGVGWNFTIHDSEGAVTKSGEGYLSSSPSFEKIVDVVMPQRLQE